MQLTGIIKKSGDHYVALASSSMSPARERALKQQEKCFKKPAQNTYRIKGRRTRE